jgi:hypothetical protein
MCEIPGFRKLTAIVYVLVPVGNVVETAPRAT